jgi:hypothetical protein
MLFRRPTLRNVFVSPWALAALAAACTPPAAEPDDGPLNPAFVVSDHFTPSGYMGDGTVVGVVEQVAAVCPDRAPEAVGDCYRVVYTPPSPPMKSFAGVYWQFPANNWGTYYGHKVNAGATHARVWARAERADLTSTYTITFKAGGIFDTTLPHQDSLQASGTAVNLTSQWQSYDVSFDGAKYDEVIGAFAWVVNLSTDASASANPAPIVFYIDGITWSP